MNTQDLIKTARARFNHYEGKLLLEEKYRAKLTLAFGGGLWNITPELLAYLKCAPTVVVMVDSFNTPIKLDSRAFLEHAEPIYYATMDQWYSEYEQLKNNR